MSGRGPEAARPTQNESKAVHLVEAKDRATITATVAMSVVHVAYLRAIVVAGPDSSRFYTIVLSLVIISLVLQVAAGLLSLVISQMKSYYLKHHDDMCYDVRQMCFYCCCPPRLASEVCEAREAHEAYEAGQSSSTDSKGCVISCTGHSPMTDYEKDVYRYTETINKDIVKVELEAIEAESSIAAITDTITECRNKQEELMKKKDTIDPTEYTKMLKELKEQEETANGRLARYKKTTGKLSMMEKKQTALNERMEELVREDIYKRVAFWQNCLNYILYVIVVSNIFITGLGMGEAAMEDGASAPNAAKNTTVVSNTK
ncbi:hypothetical protein LSAT2_029119 [Lamellibrachia satsuma]|nr:hypothetical protein LSAT2_029119 [Lamellibrachia satsuma]